MDTVNVTARPSLLTDSKRKNANIILSRRLNNTEICWSYKLMSHDQQLEIFMSNIHCVMWPQFAEIRNRLRVTVQGAMKMIKSDKMHINKKVLQERGRGGRKTAWPSCPATFIADRRAGVIPSLVTSVPRNSRYFARKSVRSPVCQLGRPCNLQLHLVEQEVTRLRVER